MLWDRWERKSSQKRVRILDKGSSFFFSFPWKVVNWQLHPNCMTLWWRVHLQYEDNRDFPSRINVTAFMLLWAIEVYYFLYHKGNFLYMIDVSNDQIVESKVWLLSNVISLLVLYNYMSFACYLFLLPTVIKVTQFISHVISMSKTRVFSLMLLENILMLISKTIWKFKPLTRG